MTMAIEIVLPLKNSAENVDWCCVVVPGPLHGARQVAHPARQHHRAAQRHGLNRDIVHEETYNHQGMLVSILSTF